MFFFLKVFAAGYTSLAFINAWRTTAAHCLLAEHCDLTSHWPPDAFQQHWELAWQALAVGALILPFAASWRRQLLASTQLLPDPCIINAMHAHYHPSPRRLCSQLCCYAAG